MSVPDYAVCAAAVVAVDLAEEAVSQPGRRARVVRGQRRPDTQGVSVSGDPWVSLT